jgi:hypothetical protein
MVLSEITRNGFSFTRRQFLARRVLFFYSYLFRNPPTVVLHVPDRLKGRPYASVSAAVSELAEDYGLSVIVDGTANALPPDLLHTGRQTVMEIGPMTREEIESIPEMATMMAALKRHCLADPVWRVLGGSPVHYVMLQGLIGDSMPPLSDSATSAAAATATASEEFEKIVKEYVVKVLCDALCDIIYGSDATKNIVRLFREGGTNRISVYELHKRGMWKALQFEDGRNRVLREGHGVKGEWYLEPASPAISLIISERIYDPSRIGDGDGTVSPISKLADRLFREAAETKCNV